MRLPIIHSVFRKELTELLRNRRSLMVMFGVPLLLYPILTIAVASLTESKQNEMAKRTAVVAVVHGEAAPKLLSLLNDPQAMIRAVEAQAADDTRSELNSGLVDAVLTAPDHYEVDAIAGQDVKLSVAVDRSRQVTSSVESKLNKVLNSYQEWILQQRLAAHGLPTDLAMAPKHITTDVATSEQSFGALMAQILPVLLLLTGMLGALYPALSATTNERELGTLETLLVTPATRQELLTAKAGIVLISGLLTALLNMVSMSLVFWRVMSQAGKAQAGFSIDPMALALSYLAAVPTIVFFTSLVLMVGMLARNLREANAYATPLMMVPIISMLVGVADPAMTPGLLITPVVNTTLIIRAVLTGKVHAGAFALAFVSAAVYAGLMLSLAGRLFTNEQLVNPAWEPLSLRGLSRLPRRSRWPAVDEAMCLFAVSLLLNFYLSPSWVKYGLLPLLIGVEILLIAGPAVLFGYLGRYPWREVFSLRKPAPAAMIGAILLGVGLMPVMSALGDLQQYWHILPRNGSDMEGLSKLFQPALEGHPILAPLLIGLLAGVCEELLFRGPIQAALIRRFSVGVALTLGGLLFAAAHVDLPGLPVRMILGIVLGWMVYRGKSIYPAMLMHATFDAVGAYLMARGLDKQALSMWVLVGGAGVSVAGFVLVRMRMVSSGKLD